MLFWIIQIWEGIFDSFGISRVTSLTGTTYDANWVATGFYVYNISNTERGVFLGICVSLTFLGVLYAFYRVSKFYLLKIWRSRKW